MKLNNYQIGKLIGCGMMLLIQIAVEFSGIVKTSNIEPHPVLAIITTLCALMLIAFGDKYNKRSGTKINGDFVDLNNVVIDTTPVESGIKITCSLATNKENSEKLKVVTEKVREFLNTLD